ncbi:NUDIX domain-containing protein [Streptomyces sp. NPDC053474]|uniref:NUDIX domain-containing protein n=1 Tax=Streptomyces sp. NPDC053474 TaxID=3365704 RepID=UPI0037CEFBA4
MAAGVLFFDAQGHVMVLEPMYREYRDIPGGYVDAGESPLQACVREVREALGIMPGIGRPLAVDWDASPAERDKVLYLFDGGALPAQLEAQIQLQRSEIKAYAFHSLDDFDSLTIPRLARSGRAVVIARSEGQVAYLERG